MNKLNVDVVVIGAGQAGLAMSYRLKNAGVSHVVLERQPAAGGSWPSYYDSLTLFSPAGYSSLPGLEFPGGSKRYPKRDEVTAYLRQYASTFELPVRPNSEVVEVISEASQHRVTLADGAVITAQAVVVATGGFNTPYLPDIPGRQLYHGTILHSSAYRTPTGFEGKRVVVVGAANSAVQIAHELHSTANVVLATREPVKFMPQRFLGFDFHDWLKWTGLGNSRWLSDQSTPVLDVGRYRHALRTGAISRREMFTAFTGDGVVWPNAEIQGVDAVIFATGFRPNTSFLPREAVGPDGRALHSKGVSTTIKGLYYLGLPLQRNFASATLRGVGSDSVGILSIIVTHLRSA